MINCCVIVIMTSYTERTRHTGRTPHREMKPHIFNTRVIITRNKFDISDDIEVSSTDLLMDPFGFGRGCREGHLP